MININPHVIDMSRARGLDANNILASWRNEVRRLALIEICVREGVHEAPVFLTRRPYRRGDMIATLSDVGVDAGAAAAAILNVALANAAAHEEALRAALVLYGLTDLQLDEEAARIRADFVPPVRDDTPPSAAEPSDVDASAEQMAGPGVDDHLSAETGAGSKLIDDAPSSDLHMRIATMLDAQSAAKAAADADAGATVGVAVAPARGGK